MFERAKLGAAMLTLVCVATAGAGCSSNELQYQRTTIDGQEVLRAARTDAPIRGVVIVFHGLDRDETLLELDDAHTELTATLADAGFAVVAASAGGNAYGNAESQRHYSALVHDSIDRYDADTVFFLAESMGTVAAVNIMADEEDLPVAGLAAINPLLNLDALSTRYREAAEEAFAGQPLSTSNPLALPVDSIAGQNLRLYVTPEDLLVSTSENASAFEERFGETANISLVRCSGAHLDPSCIQGEDIVEWFDSITPE